MADVERKVRFYSRKELLDTQRGWKEVMPTIHEQTDKRMALVEGLACRDGCAHCCKLQVTVLPHEVMDVVDHIKFSGLFDRPARDDILGKLKAAVELSEGMDEHAYRAADIRCPFLSDEDRCRVYSVRPMSCRAFGSTNVNICDLSVPDDGTSTFRVVPDSFMRLLATSGLFFTPFLKSCLQWWRGYGIESLHTAKEEEAIVALQRLIESGRIGSEPRAAPIMARVQINGVPR